MISPKRLEELENIPESAIDTSDIPELDESFWETAKLVKPHLEIIMHKWIETANALGRPIPQPKGRSMFA